MPGEGGDRLTSSTKNPLPTSPLPAASIHQEAQKQPRQHGEMAPIYLAERVPRTTEEMDVLIKELVCDTPCRDDHTCPLRGLRTQQPQEFTPESSGDQPIHK